MVWIRNVGEVAKAKNVITNTPKIKGINHFLERNAVAKATHTPLPSIKPKVPQPSIIKQTTSTIGG